MRLATLLLSLSLCSCEDTTRPPVWEKFSRTYDPETGIACYWYPGYSSRLSCAQAAHAPDGGAP